MANTYLFVEGMPGTVSLFGTPGWQRLQSFSWATPGAGISGAANGYVFQKECNVTRDEDKMSGQFSRNAASGAHLPLAVVYTEAKSGGMTITLRNCTISHYSIAEDYSRGTAVDAIGIQFMEGFVSGGTPVTQLLRILAGQATAV